MLLAFKLRGNVRVGMLSAHRYCNVLSSFPLCQQVLWQSFHSKSCAAEARGEHARAAALPIISCADSGFRIGMKVLISQARLARPLSLRPSPSMRVQASGGTSQERITREGAFEDPKRHSLFLSLSAASASAVDKPIIRCSLMKPNG